MNEILSALRDPAVLKYASIPLVAAIVGWGTNWVAIKMTFHPLEFIGIRPIFGWQGIIPSKATKMATTFVDTTMVRLGRLSEVFEKMEPEVLARRVAEVMDRRLPQYTDEVILRGHAVLWENLPEIVKEQIYAGVRAEMPALIDGLMQEIGDNVEDLMDLKHMVVSKLEGDKDLLNRLFLEAGSAEFKFIVRSGFTFGLIFGIIQLLVWIFVPQWWVLPVFGLLVGWATNWIAINIIFRPLYPKKIGPFSFQGLFLRRQQEVASVWCHLVTREIITIKNIVHELMTGPKSERTRGLIARHVRPVVDRAVGTMRPMAQIAVGPRSYASIKASVAEKALHVSEDPFEDQAFNEDRAEIIEAILRERMVSMPPDQFQDLLRPCFQEDELKLILVGAILGGLAGTAQLLLVFGLPGAS